MPTPIPPQTPPLPRLPTGLRAVAVACWLAQCSRALTPGSAGGEARAGAPRLLGRLAAGLGAAGEALPWPSQQRPRGPACSGLGLEAASFPAIQWFLPMAPAQSDDSGQFRRQGRAPSSRQIRYHGDWSPPQPERGREELGRRIWAFPGHSWSHPSQSTEQTQHRADAGYRTRLTRSQTARRCF